MCTSGGVGGGVVVTGVETPLGGFQVFFYIKLNLYTARSDIEVVFTTSHYILPCGLPGVWVPVTLNSISYYIWFCCVWVTLFLVHSLFCQFVFQGVSLAFLDTS